MAKLTDPWFEARLMHVYADADDTHIEHDRESLDHANALFLWCPCGFGKPEYPLGGARPHGLVVPFANPQRAPMVPADYGPVARDGVTRPRWTVSGTSLRDISIAPSVDVGDPSCWHGFITAGEVR